MSLSELENLTAYLPTASLSLRGSFDSREQKPSTLSLPPARCMPSLAFALASTLRVGIIRTSFLPALFFLGH